MKKIIQRDVTVGEQRGELACSARGPLDLMSGATFGANLVAVRAVHVLVASLLLLGFSCGWSQEVTPAKLSSRTAEFAAFEAKLNQTTTVLYINQPLSSVLVDLAKKHGVSIRLDEKAVKANPESPSLPISISLKSVSLRSVLRLMLRAHKLDYIIRDGRVLITTQSLAESAHQNRSFVIPASLSKDSEALLSVVQELIVVDSDIGVAEVDGERLLVSAPRGILREVETLLKQLEGTAGKNDTYSRIQQELEKPTKMNFAFTLLGEAIGQISANHQIPIVVDRRKLDEAGISVDTNVTFELEGVRLGSSLRFLLHQYDLSYIIQNEVVVVTTKKVADGHRRIGVYTMPAAALPHMNKVRDMLMRQSDLWRSSGGPNRVATFRNQLVVNGTYLVNEGTGKFVDDLTVRFNRNAK